MKLPRDLSGARLVQLLCILSEQFQVRVGKGSFGCPLAHRGHDRGGDHPGAREKAGVGVVIPAESGNPGLPALAFPAWMPACAGMTDGVV